MSLDQHQQHYADKGCHDQHEHGRCASGIVSFSHNASLKVGRA